MAAVAQRLATLDRGERGEAMTGQIDTIAVIGGGFMGAGVAETAAIAGCRVIVRDVDERATRAACERLDASLDRAVSGGKLTEPDRHAALDRVTLTTALSAVSDAQLVLEAIPEDVQLKEQLMRELSEIVADDAIVASNTSSIPIAQLAAHVAHPERVVGLHFFSPVPVMRLVEVVRALDTSEETVSTVKELAERLGKQPIETKDRSGFIVNMLLVPYLMAAVRMYEDDFARREDIDAGMRLGCGHPMGPLALCDFIGLDVLYAVCQSLYEEFKRPEYAPPPLMKRMIAAGRLGRKSGRGFYEY
jgi:3-hydroxybutyryl-CoA dehydrogenase